MRTIFEDPFSGKWTISGDPREYSTEEIEAIKKLLLDGEDILTIKFSLPPHEDYKQVLKKQTKNEYETKTDF